MLTGCLAGPCVGLGISVVVSKNVAFSHSQLVGCHVHTSSPYTPNIGLQYHRGVVQIPRLVREGYHEVQNR